MNEIVIETCEFCGGKLKSLILGNLSGLFCDNCQQWTVVTTYIAQINLDENLYKIYLLNKEKADSSNIKLIANISNINFLEAKKLLDNSKPIIYEGKAIEIVKIIKELKKAHLEFKCIPEFPWLENDS